MSAAKGRTEKKLRFEGLEPRHMMAGNVYAFVDAAANLRVIGDALANDIEVKQVGDGAYQVYGQGQSTVNGSARAVVFSGVKNDIDIWGAAGDDTIIVSSSAPTNRLMAPHQLNVCGNEGNDYILIKNVNVVNALMVSGGAGSDYVDVESTWSQGDMNIDLGWYNDNSYVNPPGNTLYIRGSWVGFNPSQKSSLNIWGGQGNDSVTIDKTAVDNIYAALGNGDDFLSVTNSNVALNSRLYGGSGSNRINWYNNRIGSGGYEQFSSLTTRPSA